MSVFNQARYFILFSHIQFQYEQNERVKRAVSRSANDSEGRAFQKRQTKWIFTCFYALVTYE